MRLPILAFAAGVLLLQCQPVLPPLLSVWLTVAGGGLLLALWRWPGRRLLAALLCLVLGFAWASWRAELRLADALSPELEGRDVTVQGVVAALPQESAQGKRFEFAVETALSPGFTVPGRILLSCYEGRRDSEVLSCPALRPGERWRFVVRLKRPHGNANPQSFDYEAWLLERGIRATGYLRQKTAERLDALVWSPLFLVERLRQSVRDGFRSRLPAADYPYAGILSALAVGDQQAIENDLWTLFNRTGTTHLMSISGLHVTMVAALFGWLTSFLWRRFPVLALRLPAQRAGIVAAVLAALFYTLLAGFAVPAQRTLYMLAVAALSQFSGRLLAPSRTLCLALLVVLLIDPWAVLAAGFWLSFTAVAVLLFVGAALVGESATLGWREHLAAWGRVQWAATLASLPILLLVFQQFSLVSPLANALAIPVVSFIVTPLALLGAILPWWPILALAHAVLAGLMIFLTWCATWTVWQVPAPPLWAVLAAGLGVLLCLLPRGVPGRASGFLLLLPALFWPADRPAAGSARITVLDVGQGLASVVQTHDHLLVYDPGPLYGPESDAGQRVVVPYLRVLGANRVDMMILSHRDSDHAGGAASVVSALPVEEVRSSYGEPGSLPCRAGLRWQWDGVDFEILHPGQNPVPQGDFLRGAVDGKNSNNFSCVLRVVVSGHAMLLTADLEASDEAVLLAQTPAKLAADVLQVAHHGSRSSSSAEFLVAVGAKEAVIPVGYRNRFGHPVEEVLARLEALDSRLWRTDRDGALRIDLAAEGVRVAAWREEHRRYWHGR